MLFLPDTIVAEFNLTEDEQSFFNELWHQFSAIPYEITLHRSSKYAPFNVYLGDWGYIGKVRLYDDPPKYAVMEIGKKRAKRLFDNEQSAMELSAKLPNSFVEIRKPKDERFMQIQTGTFVRPYTESDPDVDLQAYLNEYKDSFRLPMKK